MPARKRRRDVDAAPSLATTQSVKYGANQSEKFFTLRPGNVTAGSKSKLEQLSKLAVVRSERSFSAERTEQSLRHVATLLKGKLDAAGVQGYQEVQVGLRTVGGSKSVLASTNTNEGNKALREIVANETVASLAAKIDASSLGSRSAREARHLGKLRKPERNKAALGVFSEAPIEVPGDVSKSMDGLHAERRIKEQGGGAIRGIMRPCAHCFTQVNPEGEKQIEAGTGPGPGPMWTSNAARLKGARASKHLTRLTRARSGGITYQHDTDSDSDA